MDTWNAADMNEYRDVGGRLVSMASACTQSAHVEVLSRETGGDVEWRFRQSRLALFWFQSGVSGMHVRLNGKAIDSPVSAGSNLALIPAFAEIEGEVKAACHCDYAVVFLDTDWIRQRLDHSFDLPLVTFGSREIQRSLPILCGEVRREDPLFELFVEGWALQTLALLSRVTTPMQTPRSRGGLATTSLRRVREYIAADLTQPFTIEDLSQVAGVSARHFIRAFQESTGLTPFRFIMGLRVERAKQMLVATRLSATEIALECGFSHAQHFTNSFRNATGTTPSAYRKSALL